MVSRISNLKQIWQTVIGLEIHAQISSNTKLFSVAKNKFNLGPNSQVAFFDLATPGTLPIINGRCVQLALVAAVALKCDIESNSEFDRKHYFYSDMPAGYQITQHRRPIARNGCLNFFWSLDPSSKAKGSLKHSKIRITQMHIEQDSGKSFHDYKNNISLIDLNRAGVGLLEIVTEPQFTNEYEAAGFVKELKDVLSELEVCTGQMSDGALRVDVNVSVKPVESDQLGVRTETKNIGSVQGVLKAIEFESRRQIELLENGGKVTNETRFFNPETETTFSMRDKEVIQDYRYYPEPNLPTLRLREHCSHVDGNCGHKFSCIQCARRRLENYSYPFDTLDMITTKYNLSLSYASLIYHDADLYQWIQLVSELSRNYVDSEREMNWFRILGHVTVTLFLKELYARSLTAKYCPISRENYAEYVTITCDYSTTKVKLLKVLTIMFDFPEKSPKSIIKENNWYRISDSDSIEHIVRDFIKRHPAALQSYKSGKKKADEFFKKKIRTENDNLLDHAILDSTIDRILDE